MTGYARCPRHAGPKAANALRQRQIADLAAGRISPAEFERRELRRAANRLREAWKRDPWTPGRTIDLGEHEARFLTESGVARLDTPIAPAVLDWLRWRYRRLQIDRRRDEEWARVMREAYPRRVRDAGVPPPQYDPRAAGAVKPRWTAVPPPARSKRVRQERLRASAPSQEAKALKLPYLDDIEVSEADLVRVAYEQRGILAPLLKLCSRCEQRALVRALAIYLERPTDLAAMRKWAALLTDVRERA